MRFYKRSHYIYCQKEACIWLKSSFIKNVNGIIYINTGINFRRLQLSNLGTEFK